ncbi:MAG: oligosaccharide flippase family protein [Eubacteriales bacterium]
MRKGGKFLINMTLLTASSLLLNIITMSFRVWVSKTAGAEVLGLHQLLYSVYSPACTLACSGINLAVTRIVSSSSVSGMTVKSTMRRALAYSVSFGIVAQILLYICAPFVETHLMKTEGVALCLRILSFGLPFLSSASALHGMFTALRKVYKSVIVQATEDLSKIAVTAALLLTVLKGKSPAVTCISLVAGSACAETLSCIVAAVLYFTEKERKTGGTGGKGIAKRIFSIAMPTALSSYVRAALSAFENLMIPVGLRKNGLKDSQIYAKLGVLRGMVFPMIMFPSVLLSSCSRLLVPEISEAFEKGDRREISRTAARTIKLTLVFSFIISSVFIFFADGLGMLLYSSTEAGKMLRLMAPLVPLMYLDGIIDAMLKGVNEQVASMRFNIIDSLVSAAATAILLPQYGFEGYFVITYVTTCLNAFLSLDRFLGVIKMKIPAREFVVLPVLAATAATLPVTVYCHLADVTQTVIPISVCAVLYIMIIFVSGVLRKEKT